MSSTDKVLPYYDYQPLLSRNGVFNFVTGGRGLGKTYGAKKWSIDDYLKRGNQFIYLRRYKSEQAGRRTFFDDIAQRYPDEEFRCDGFVAEHRKAGTKNWRTMGFFTQLSNAMTQKSIAYPNVTKIIYDEYIIEKGVIRYLPDETLAFNEFYSTVDRWKDKTRVLFLANSVSIMNPYFMDYGIEPDGSEWITRNDGFVVCHFPRANDFASAVYQTRFGTFIAGTEYANYAIGNEFKDNHRSLVRKKPHDAQYFFTLETKAGVFSLWCDNNDPEFLDRVYYVQEARPRDGETIGTMLFESMGENKQYMEYGNKMLTRLRTAFAQGRVFFSTPKIRNAFSGIYRR